MIFGDKDQFALEITPQIIGGYYGSGPAVMWIAGHCIGDPSIPVTLGDLTTELFGVVLCNRKRESYEAFRMEKALLFKRMIATMFYSDEPFIPFDDASFFIVDAMSESIRSTTVYAIFFEDKCRLLFNIGSEVHEHIVDRVTFEDVTYSACSFAWYKTEVQTDPKRYPTDFMVDLAKQFAHSGPLR